MTRATLLLATGTVSVRDIRCDAARGGCGAERGGEAAHLALVRGGGFGYHPGRRRYLADPSTALFHRAGVDYRVSHPLAHGDRCTIVECAPALQEELFGVDALAGRQVAFAVDPRSQAAHLALWQDLATQATDWPEPIGIEERVLELLACLRRLPRLAPCGSAQRLRQRLDDARVLLAGQLDRNLDIASVAGTLQLSPFHLMRSFRAQTGHSLRGYRRYLRVAAALERLAEGCDDLTKLALELGFASHSHMDAAFARELGQSPSQLRHRLTYSRQLRLRTFLQAGRSLRA